MKPVTTKGKLLVQDTVVSFTRIEQGDFISLSPSKWIETTGSIGIRQNISQSERLLALNNTVIHQMRSLLGAAKVLKLK